MQRLSKGHSMTKRKVLFGCWIVCVISLAPAARADVTFLEIDARTGDSLEVIRMTVTPAAEPVPALKYRLIARDIDLKPGNAAPYYYRTLLELPSLMRRVREKFNEDEKLGLWYATGTGATPIADLPIEQMREASQMFEWIIDEHLADAVMRRDCNWQLDLEELRGTKVISVVLNEFQNSRELARMLSLRTRLAIAEGRYGDAVETMRMNYQLATDVAIEPYLVCGLIGIAIDGITNGTVIDLVAAPDSPNLYWALTELPQPMIDMRPAVRFEIDFGPRMFPFIHHAETTDRSPQEWNRLYTQAFRDLATIGEGGIAARSDTGAGLVATAAALLGYPHAKAQLIAQGMDRERLERMAVGQVMAIYTERTCQRFADDFQKLWYVSFEEMRKYYDAVDERLRDANPLDGGAEREVLPIASLLLPAMQAARTAQVRLDRDIAALRVIEALRMFAAEHDGRLPERLDDIDAVPVPPNPATSKPFVYQLDGQTAILELPPSDRIPGYNRRFEIQIAAPEKEIDATR